MYHQSAEKQERCEKQDLKVKVKIAKRKPTMDQITHGP